jgi:hypothetical protein
MNYAKGIFGVELKHYTAAVPGLVPSPNIVLWVSGDVCWPAPF